MNKEEALAFYKIYQDKTNAYNLARNTIYFDMATIAPKNGNDTRIKLMSILAGEAFDYSTSYENIQKLEEMAQMDLGEEMNEELRQQLKGLHLISRLPKDFYMEYQELTAKGEIAWEQAKEANDWNLFKDVLKELVLKSKQAAKYYGFGEQPYNGMLDQYEEGMTIEKYDHFFDLIKTELLPFIKKLVNEGTPIDDSPLFQHFPEHDQIKVMDILKKQMNFDSSECYMGVSAHPFTTSISLHDARITTKYLEDSLVSSIFSIIHEYGHAQYSLHVNPKFEGMTLEQNMSSGMHESQSRFLENYIGKLRSFWVNCYPQVKEIFGEQLKDIELDDFIKMINVSKPSLIRTEADELTYPIHILIRYECEKEMINGTIDFEHLDEIWADKYEEYLGIRPQNVSEGILQDIHWSGASFGYFPTYALGSAYAAQFFEAMKKDLDIDQALENNHFNLISDWLTTHIHQYGSFKSADVLLQEVCHTAFDPHVYISYLIDKYSKLYNI